MTRKQAGLRLTPQEREVLLCTAARVAGHDRDAAALSQLKSMGLVRADNALTLFGEQVARFFEQWEGLYVPPLSRVTVEITAFGQASALLSAVENILDAGILQDEINGHEDHSARFLVESALVTGTSDAVTKAASIPVDIQTLIRDCRAAVVDGAQLHSAVAEQYHWLAVGALEQAEHFAKLAALAGAKGGES